MSRLELNIEGPVIGLDLSLTSSGVVLLHKHGPLEAFTFPSGKPKAKGTDRLVRLHDQLTELLEWSKPGLAVVEDLPIGGRGAGLTGMAQGVAREVLWRNSLPLVLVVPSTLKKSATGDGRADKAKMRERLPEGAGESLKNSDEVDAFWLAQVGNWIAGRAHHLTHTDNLEKLKLQE